MVWRSEEAFGLAVDDGGDGGKGEEGRLKRVATLLRPLKMRLDQLDLSLNSIESTPYGRPAYRSVSVEYPRGPTQNST